MHGLTNWSSRSKDAHEKNQDSMLEAVRSNDKLTEQNLVELNEALDRIGKLQGSDQKISKMQFFFSAVRSVSG